MKKILFIIIALLFFNEAFSQVKPTNPVQVNTMTWYKDINGKMWAYRGTSLGWIQMADSTQIGGSCAGCALLDGNNNFTGPNTFNSTVNFNNEVNLNNSATISPVTLAGTFTPFLFWNSTNNKISSAGGLAYYTGSSISWNILHEFNSGATFNSTPPNFNNSFNFNNPDDFSALSGLKVMVSAPSADNRAGIVPVTYFANTATNGLNKTGSAIGLGGTLNGFTNIDINGNTLQIFSNTGAGYSSGSSFDEQQNVMSNGETISLVQGGTSIITTPAEVSLNTNNALGSGRTTTFKLNSGGQTAFALIDTSYSAMYRDDFKHAGIVYSHVNRSNYTDTTLVDKGYVDLISIPRASTISALQAYSGPSYTVLYTDSLAGGIFNYYPSVTLNDGGVNFTATGKGSGTWSRQTSGSDGVNLRWFGAIDDYDPVTNTGTDNYPFIQAALNSTPSRSGKFYLPGSKKNRRYYGISQPIRVGNATHLEGDVPSFPVQYNTGPADTIYYRSPSTLYAYNGTGAVMTDTTVSYRCQSVNLTNISLVGTGKTNNATGLSFYSNTSPSLIVSNVNARDVGLIDMNKVYIDGFTTPVDGKRADTWHIMQCHFSRGNVGVRGGKQDLSMKMTCLFDLDSAAVVTGSRYFNLEDNEVEPGTNSIGFYITNILDAGATKPQFNNIINNHFKGTKTGISAKSGSASMRISNNQFISNVTGVRLDSVSTYNVIDNNTFSSGTGYNVYARKTDRLVVSHNISTVAPSGFAFARLDTCLLVQVNDNYDQQYSTLLKYDMTGSTQQDISVSSSIRMYGNNAYNPAPGITGLVSAGTFKTPTAIGSGQTLFQVSGSGYTGSAFASQVQLRLSTNQTWGTSARGTKIVAAVTPNGSTSMTRGINITGTGLYSGDTTTVATAWIDAPASTATQLGVRVRPGVVLTTPLSGAIENDGTDLFYTTSTPTRRTVANLTAAQTFTNKTLTTPKLTGYTVATLPAGTIGMLAYVTDATAPTFLGVLVGGGSTVTPVFYNGTAWVSY